jgi:hypothetical protein
MFGNQLPDEMWSDPKLNKLKLSGPFGTSHDRLRKAYYAIRDGKPLPISNERLKEEYNYITKECPGLWSRGDDTPRELNVICEVVAKHLVDNHM